MRPAESANEPLRTISARSGPRSTMSTRLTVAPPLRTTRPVSSSKAKSQTFSARLSICPPARCTASTMRPWVLLSVAVIAPVSIVIASAVSVSASAWRGVGRGPPAAM